MLPVVIMLVWVVSPPVVWTVPVSFGNDTVLSAVGSVTASVVSKSLAVAPSNIIALAAFIVTVSTVVVVPATVSLGTSGTAYTFLEKPYVDPEGEIASFCDSTGNYLPLLCVSNLANGFDEFCRINNLSPRQFDELINETEPGNDGRILIPWYEGERTPDIPNATPIYFGFALHDFDQKTLARAIIEGHLLNLYIKSISWDELD